MVTMLKNYKKALAAGTFFAIVAVPASAFSHDSWLASLDEFFPDFGSAFSAPSKSRDTAEKDLKAHVTKLREESKKLAAAADNLAESLEKKNLDDSTDTAISKVFDSFAVVKESVHGLQRESNSIKRARASEERAKTPQFKLQSNVDEIGNTFVVTATLPNVEKEALRITVSCEDEFGRERQTLRIKAVQKEAQTAQTSGLTSTSMSSTRYLNGRREELTVNDRQIEIIVDLPQDVTSDLEKVQQSMNFENGKLELSFPYKKEKRKKETELRFDSAEGKEVRKMKIK